MAIDTSNNNLIEQFISEATTLHNYISNKNSFCNPDFSPKYSVKLGKIVYKKVQTIINTPALLEEFIKLLDSKDLLIAYLSAEHLYPLYPTKCLKIMKKFHNSLDDNIDRYTVMSKFEGISRKKDFFMERYKKLYNCEDLDSLNREKRKRKSK